MGIIHYRANALDCLNQTGAEQRNEHEVDSVEASIQEAEATANYRLAVPKRAGADPTVEVRVPGYGNAGAKRPVEGFVRIFLPSSGIANQRKADLREPGAAADREPAPGVRRAGAGGYPFAVLNEA